MRWKSNQDMTPILFHNIGERKKIFTETNIELIWNCWHSFLAADTCLNFPFQKVISLSRPMLYKVGKYPVKIST